SIVAGTDRSKRKSEALGKDLSGSGAIFYLLPASWISSLESEYTYAGCMGAPCLSAILIASALFVKSPRWKSFSCPLKVSTPITRNFPFDAGNRPRTAKDVRGKESRAGARPDNSQVPIVPFKALFAVLSRLLI